MLAPFLHKFHDLPTRMIDFSTEVGGLFRQIGGSGRKTDIQFSLLLVTVSEIVRLALGSPYDEALAELYQIVSTSDAETHVPPFVTQEISGNAIRKKRKYLQTHFPEINAAAMQQAERALAQIRPLT